MCLLLILSNKLDLNQETRFTINCLLSYSWFQISQTGGQWYSDTPPLVFPAITILAWIKRTSLSRKTLLVAAQNFYNVLTCPMMTASLLKANVDFLANDASRNDWKTSSSFWRRPSRSSMTSAPDLEADWSTPKPFKASVTLRSSLVWLWTPVLARRDVWSHRRQRCFLRQWHSGPIS